MGIDVSGTIEDGHNKEETLNLVKGNSHDYSPIDMAISNPEIRVFSLTELLSDKSDPPEQLIGNGVLPQKGILLIHGAPKSGKSLLTLNLALKLSSGESWLGFDVNRSNRVLIIQAEVTYYAIRDRLTQMVGSNVYKEDFYITDAIGFDIMSKIQRIRDWINQFYPDVIIIDPLKDYHYRNENDNSEMALVMMEFRKITLEHEVSIILVHHSRKGKENSGGSNIRGASNIFGSVDSQIEIIKKRGGVRALNFESRYGSDLDPINIDLNSNLVFELSDSPGSQCNEDQLISQMEADKGYAPKDLEGLFKKKTGRRRSTFNSTRKKCEDAGRIIKRDNGQYYKK